MNPTRFTSQPQLNGTVTTMPQQHLSTTTNPQHRNITKYQPHPHTSHTTLMNLNLKNTIPMSHLLKSGLSTTKNHQCLSSTMMNQQVHTMRNQPSPQLLSTTMKNPQPNHTTIMSQQQSAGTVIMNNQQLNSIHMKNQLNHGYQQKNHLHILPTTTMNHPPNHTSNIHHLLFHGMITSTNHPLNSITMNQQLNHTMQSQNHLHTSSTMDGQNLLRHISHTNQPQFNGLISTNHQLLNSTTTNLQLKNTTLNQNHLHSKPTIILNHQHLPISNIPHLQQSGLITMKSHQLNSIHTNHSQKNIHTQLKHLHTKHTTTMNPQLKAISNILHLQLPGHHTTMNHQFSSTTTNHQLTPIMKNTNHPHILHTIAIMKLLKATNHMNQPLFHGQITSKNQALKSSIMNLQLTFIPLNTSHLHSKSITTMNHQLSHTNTMNHLQQSGPTIMKSHQLNSTLMSHTLRLTLMLLNHLHM